jgi:hypothetical protein
MVASGAGGGKDGHECPGERLQLVRLPGPGDRREAGEPLQQYDGRLVLCPPKTAGSERAVALDRTTVAVLRAHRVAQDAERAAAGKDYRDSGYVFTCLNGDPMAPDRLSRTFRLRPGRRPASRRRTVRCPPQAAAAARAGPRRGRRAAAGRRR